MTRIKICGITNQQDAEFARACGVDALGFVFAESPRQVNLEQARAIIAGVDPFAVSVGVFVDTPAEEVRSILEFTGCRVAQLHGAEGPEYLEELTPFAVVKVLRVRDGIGEADRRAWLQPGSGVQAILLDTFVPGKAGGTGKRFDPSVAEELVREGHRVIVAGGLTPDNVGEVVRRVRPWGVDVSSGVEYSPGRKDHAKVADFVAAVREADQEMTA